MNIYAQDDEFWETYIKGRPRVPESFFERIYSYHASKGGAFDTVHDAGAGAGVHSARLAKRFSHVILSDASSENIEAAKRRLHGNDTFSFQVAKLEDGADIAPASIDVFFSCAALHYSGDRVDEGMKRAATQLKPGGTFAAAAFGLAVFDDPDIQQLWLRLFQRSVERTLDTKPAMHAYFVISASAYDAVPLSTAYFAPDAQRIKINFGDEWSWRPMQVPPKYEGVVAKSNRIGEQEEISFETDAGWRFEMDSNDLKDHKASFPTLTETNEAEALWHELLRLVSNRKITGSWPAVLVLATRI